MVYGCGVHWSVSGVRVWWESVCINVRDECVRLCVCELCGFRACI